MEIMCYVIVLVVVKFERKEKKSTSVHKGFVLFNCQNKILLGKKKSHEHQQNPKKQDVA